MPALPGHAKRLGEYVEPSYRFLVSPDVQLVAFAKENFGAAKTVVRPKPKIVRRGHPAAGDRGGECDPSCGRQYELFEAREYGPAIHSGSWVALSCREFHP